MRVRILRIVLSCAHKFQTLTLSYALELECQKVFFGI